MIVVQVGPELSFEVIDREKEMVRLGAGGLDGRALTDTAMSAALQTLSKFKRLADSHGVEEVIGAATSAVREIWEGSFILVFIASILEGTNAQQLSEQLRQMAPEIETIIHAKHDVKSRLVRKAIAIRDGVAAA